ncbi:hypothetical protein J5N97_013030 [Dioscorea zingiberensis]|uniref:Uncharacterized protein n=1 Tax=Dioscorea zingiberensis TaxID=325984 RepID=A0A9D5CPZ0_9LILI|nr:hypothetical protein J5N97_013030 [Dioscorea zingiberensis]
MIERRPRSSSALASREKEGGMVVPGDWDPSTQRRSRVEGSRSFFSTSTGRLGEDAEQPKKLRPTTAQSSATALATVRQAVGAGLFSVVVALLIVAWLYLNGIRDSKK